MENPITIIDVGRGPQLSTSRITVQDVLPFFKEGASDEEILRWMPTLSVHELRMLETYFREHTEEVLALERRIEERNARRRNSVGHQELGEENPLEDRMKKLREKLKAWKCRHNGDHPIAG